MIRIEPFTGARADAWDRFVLESRNGTFFHTRKFLSYHPADRFEDASLLFFDDQVLIAVLPAAIKQVDGKKIFVSHPGSSYGGLVLSTKAGIVDTGAILDTLTAYAKEQQCDHISLQRLTPASIRTAASDDQEYWLFQKDWHVDRFEMDGTLTIPADMDVLQILDGKCRNMVRQAERAEMSVRLSDDIGTYWKLLADVLHSRHEAKPTHSQEELRKLYDVSGGAVRLLAAYLGDTMVGGIVLISTSPTSLYTLYMAQDFAQQKHHPLHLVLVEAMRLCQKEKRTVLHLGVSTEDGGKVINEGLVFFKESFGMKPVRRESWVSPSLQS